jgi:hypothetical protein
LLYHRIAMSLSMGFAGASCTYNDNDTNGYKRIYLPERKKEKP